MFPTTAQTISTPPDWERVSNLLTVKSVPSVEDRSAEQSERERKVEFLELARERFRISALAEEKRRYEMLIDLKFRWGRQWDEWVQLKREQQGRPCLTINRIPEFLNHVMNGLRQQRPEIKVDPVADGADEDTAKIRQGVMRYVRRISQAEIADDTAFENMCITGLGFSRIVDGWSSDRSHEKDLFIQWVPNSFAVYFDPSASKPDWSDAKYCFIVEDLSLPEFRQRFGKKYDAASLESFQSIGDHAPFWLPGGKVRVAEYFYKSEETELLCEVQYPDGTVESKYSDELPLPDENGQTAFQILRTRSVKAERVKWALITGLDILRERDWFGRYIPVIPAIGAFGEVDGERMIAGMVRFARESQRMYNYMYTSFVEAIALAPKAPFIAEFNQIQRFREIWERANTDPMAVLPYEMMSTETGQPLPPPQRQQAEPPIQAFVAGLQLADQNLKATFSIYDASLGQRGPQESGVAINSRKVESDQSTYHWIDNFHRFQTHLGIVLDDLLPYYYNTPGRVIQILGEDGQSTPTPVNIAHQGDDGNWKKYDLSRGKYAISLSTGPSSETRRREAAQSMMQLFEAAPQQMTPALPMIIREFDWPGKDAIAAQIEKGLPPQFRTQDPNQQGPSPDEMQAQVAQSQQMIQKLSQIVNELTDKKAIEQQKEIYATFREQLKQETALAIAQLKTGSQEAQVMNEKLFAEMERVRVIGEQMLATQNPGAPAPITSAPLTQMPHMPAMPPPPGPAGPQVPGAPPPPGATPPA